jgi:hypothetical protein
MQLRMPSLRWIRRVESSGNSIDLTGWKPFGY